MRKKMMTKKRKKRKRRKRSCPHPSNSRRQLMQHQLDLHSLLLQRND
jgi:hypothetical protein